MPEDRIQTWLLTEAPPLRSLREVIQGFVERLTGEGIPVLRVSLSVGLLHPELLGIAYRWNRGDRFVTRSEVPYDIQLTDDYLESPYRLINEGAQTVRRRLTGPEAVLDFPVLETIRDEGATDYIAISLPRSEGGIYLTSIAVDRAEGFLPEEVERLIALRPALALVTEIHARRQTMRGLLDLYLGPEAGRRVYAGEIRRGEGHGIRSVLWMCDLRGFTIMSDHMPLQDLIAELNAYFEAVTGPIHAHGGEVLKFIGDAVLGIFRIENDHDLEDVCERALDAAELAVANMRILNHRLERYGKSPLDFSIALHVGEAMYGNVGAHDRLDFTVIGPAVNLCARLEALAAKLGEKIVCSAEFRDVSREAMRSLGIHSLHNVETPVEAFAPA